jgi:dTDP-4-dehydrorhamnose 3,5-epimerase
MRALWIPPGFAHGFLSLEDDTDFVYKCTDLWAPQFERTVAWDDGDLAIAWPLDLIGGAANVLLSDKDRLKACALRDAEVFA